MEHQTEKVMRMRINKFKYGENWKAFSNVGIVRVIN